MTRNAVSSPEPPSPKERMRAVAGRLIDALIAKPNGVRWIPDAAPSATSGPAFRAEVNGWTVRISAEDVSGSGYQMTNYRFDMADSFGDLIVSAIASTSETYPSVDQRGAKGMMQLLYVARLAATQHAEQQVDTLLTALGCPPPPSRSGLSD